MYTTCTGDLFLVCFLLCAATFASFFLPLINPEIVGEKTICNVLIWLWYWYGIAQMRCILLQVIWWMSKCVVNYGSDPVFFYFRGLESAFLTQTRIWLRGRSGVICNAYSLPGNNCQLILGFIIPSHVCSWLLWLLGSVCHVWHLSFSCFQPEDYEGVKRLP